MKYKTTHQPDSIEVEIAEQLTYADHAAFRNIIDGMIEAEARHCVIDIKALETVDSAGLGMFMIAHEECERHSTELVIRAPQGQVKRMLELARFDTILRIEG